MRTAVNTIKPVVLLLVLLSGVCQPASAQTAAESPGASQIDSGTPNSSELQALVFYLQQRNQVSAEAELRRLKSKYPNWVPPTDLNDLSATQPASEIDAIYKAIADNELTLARRLMVQAQSAYPNWTPPHDMTRLLTLAEGQMALDLALDAGNAHEALQIATSIDGLLQCDRINNAWRIAEIQGSQQADSAALTTYRAILNSCNVTTDLFATIEKADAVTSNEELAELVSIVVARFPEEQDTFVTLQKRLLAGRGAPVGNLALRSEGGERLRPRTRPAPAKRTTAPAPASGPAASAPVRQTSGGCRPSDASSRSPQRLMAYGWCVHNLDRPMEALNAFKRAEAQLSGASKRDARFGMSLAFLKLNMPDDAARIAANTRFTREQRVNVERQILDQRGNRAYKQGDFGRAIAYWDAYEQINGHMTREQLVLRGYAYYNNGNKPRARQIFQKLHDQLATGETRKALGLFHDD
ncbi:lipopolysaccharide assembly protein LapB [Phaeobacter sp. B1627]|uniref:tetratricopeptide repeat protein n=1 Tax=Phaeobacter sp. B1627 TaxID=2583809 RepID=UPI00111B4B41|nr:hypothetical protein [Phaeobacter sp. B1627]TNJ45119.1 hypothetical protein FGE21_06900 [Phaeobacter sp. B1627]